MGKAHRLYAPPSTTIYTNAFEIVHTDRWRPAPFTSSTGDTYYITFVDAYIGLHGSIFLKLNLRLLQPLNSSMP